MPTNLHVRLDLEITYKESPNLAIHFFGALLMATELNTKFFNVRIFLPEGIETK